MDLKRLLEPDYYPNIKELLNSYGVPVESDKWLNWNTAINILVAFDKVTNSAKWIVPLDEIKREINGTFQILFRQIIIIGMKIIMIDTT